MSRIPHAAKVLASQVRDKYGRSVDSKAGQETITPVGDPDGFGVVRSVEFDKTSSKWLSKVLAATGDPRIVGIEEKAGKVKVTFASGTNADTKDPFNLTDAETVAEDEDE
jgi:hypothetical protein